MKKLKLINIISRVSLLVLFFGALPILSFQLSNDSHNEQEPFWVNKGGHCIFAPGIFCSEGTVGKYCSRYNASTGEQVMCPQALELIDGDTAHSCNFAEIVLPELENTRGRWHFNKQLRALAQGFVAWRFFKPYNITISGESTTGLTLKPYLINPFNFNIGQDLDIEIYSQKYDEICERFQNKGIGLYGTSRGSGVVAGFMATEYDKKEDKRVQGVILEGCFDAVRNVTAFESLMRLLPHYKPYGKAPIDLADEFVAVCNKYKIPVLVVTSAVDTIVPYKNTIRLCDELAKKGLEELYVLVLEHSGHRDYTCNDGEDMQRYQKVVHAFNKKCDLPYNPLLAFAGQAELEKCRYVHANPNRS